MFGQVFYWVKWGWRFVMVSCGGHCIRIEICEKSEASIRRKLLPPYKFKIIPFGIRNSLSPWNWSKNLDFWKFRDQICFLPYDFSLLLAKEGSPLTDSHRSRAGSLLFQRISVLEMGLITISIFCTSLFQLTWTSFFRIECIAVGN